MVKEYEHSDILWWVCMSKLKVVTPSFITQQLKLIIEGENKDDSKSSILLQHALAVG